MSILPSLSNSPSLSTLPTVTSYSKNLGFANSFFSISISFAHPDDSLKSLHVLFGNHKISSPSLIPQDSQHQFIITLAVPAKYLAAISLEQNSVPVNLVYCDSSIYVCTYTYKDSFQGSAIPLALSKTLTPNLQHTSSSPEGPTSASSYILQSSEAYLPTQGSNDLVLGYSSLGFNQTRSEGIKSIPAVAEYSESAQRLPPVDHMGTQNQQQQQQQYFTQHQRGSSTGTISNIPLSPLETPYMPLSSHHHHYTPSTSNTSYFDSTRLDNRQYTSGMYYTPGQSGYFNTYDPNNGQQSSNLNNWNLGSQSMTMTGFQFNPRSMVHQNQMVHGHTQQQQQTMYNPVDGGSMAIPQLVRTTALSQATMSLGMGILGGIGTNHVVNDSTKASLEIVGNLDHMAQGWTLVEKQERRRLIQFKRHQRGSRVVVEFTPLDASKYTPTTQCISCILWEERNECYVTSVDCIHLLEQLINTRFTVEEKNRIRRNLEGYHPLTVSKGKVNSGDFFRLIMSFSAPKPRNIEKDVKVFKWQLLGKALEKIVGKYSADYGGVRLSLAAAAAAAAGKERFR